MKLKALSIAISAILLTQPTWAEEEMPTIIVEGIRISDVSSEEVKSADLAEALTKLVPSVSIVRRSGIANDIILRGQKKDNINVLIDDAKIYGACPNRMDPPTSHVLTNNIDAVEITEGPYDVENFGTLSGAVKITTREPKEGFHGEASLNFGSWGYQKGGLTLSGGSDRFRALITASAETSEQYEDGDGNNFAEQIANYEGSSTSGPNYKEKYWDMDAYEKKTFMGKFYLDITDNQELAVSYTANRSDDVLYPSSKMDAMYDDSDILNLDYSIRNLGGWSKQLDVQYYFSEVEHPMSNYYRVSSGPDSANEKVSKLETRMDGFKVKNALDFGEDMEILYGVDFSKRNWDGVYSGEGNQAPINGLISIDDVDTDNKAIFVELDKDYADFNLRFGARYDDTSIEPAGTLGEPSNDYDALSGFVFGTYQFNDSTKWFAGLGQASRVPDARELYFHGAMVSPMGMAMNPQIGTPDLDQTTNTEIDLGMENSFANLKLKTKLFYSWLDDFIVYNDSKMKNRFENVDASIYGVQFSGSHNATDDLYFDFGLAYQRGKKDHPLEGQTGTNLPEIPPLKLNLSMTYDYMPNSYARLDLIAADDWDKYDEENGEQYLDSYAVLNLKIKQDLTRGFEIVAGVDNIFDETYAVTNTYKDLILLTGGATGEVILMNEPGRYYYLNGTYRF